MLSLPRPILVALAIPLCATATNNCIFDTECTYKLPPVAEIIPGYDMVRSGISMIAICEKYQDPTSELHPSRMVFLNITNPLLMKAKKEVERFCGPLLVAPEVQEVLAIIEGVWGCEKDL
jgi:hypothetical protein